MSKGPTKSADDYAWSTRIDHLMHWQPGRPAAAWVKYCNNTADIWLIVHYGQLMIKTADKIFETISLNSKLKGYYKGDVLVLLVNEGNRDGVPKRRKIRFNFIECTKKYIEKLKIYFPIWGHSKNVVNSKYCTLEDVMTKAMQDTGGDGDGNDGSRITFPSNHNDFIKVCLMDPVFPQYVNEVQAFILNLEMTQTGKK